MSCILAWKGASRGAWAMMCVDVPDPETGAHHFATTSADLAARDPRPRRSKESAGRDRPLPETGIRLRPRGACVSIGMSLEPLVVGISTPPRTRRRPVTVMDVEYLTHSHHAYRPSAASGFGRSQILGTGDFRIRRTRLDHFNRVPRPLDELRVVRPESSAEAPVPSRPRANPGGPGASARPISSRGGVSTTRPSSTRLSVSRQRSPRRRTRRRAAPAAACRSRRRPDTAPRRGRRRTPRRRAAQRAPHVIPAARAPDRWPGGSLRASPNARDPCATTGWITSKARSAGARIDREQRLRRVERRPSARVPSRSPRPAPSTSAATVPRLVSATRAELDLSGTTAWVGIVPCARSSPTSAERQLWSALIFWLSASTRSSRWSTRRASFAVLEPDRSARAAPRQPADAPPRCLAAMPRGFAPPGEPRDDRLLEPRLPSCWSSSSRGPPLARSHVREDRT